MRCSECFECVLVWASSLVFFEVAMKSNSPMFSCHAYMHQSFLVVLVAYWIDFRCKVPKAKFALMRDASEVFLSSNNQTKVLTLDEPVSTTLPPIRGRVRHKHERLAEAALWLVSTIAISDMPTYNDQH